MINQGHQFLTNQLGNDPGETVPGTQQMESISANVRLRLQQCGALLHQHLERKAMQEAPHLPTERVDQIMKEFRDVSADLEASVLNRVMSKLTTHIGQEISGVLEDAISEGENVLQAPIFRPRYQEPVIPASSIALEQDQEVGPQQTQEEASFPNATQEESQAPQDLQLVIEPNSGEDDIDRFIREVEAAPLEAQAAIGDQIRARLSDPAPVIDDPRPESPSTLSDEHYTGVVRLRLRANSPSKQAIRFLEALRRQSGFNILQLVGDHKAGIGISLFLRNSVCLKSVLVNFDSVSKVEAAGMVEDDGDEPLLDVQLAEIGSPE